MLRTAIMAAVSIGVAMPLRAELCPTWSPPATVGGLDVERLPEASGMELSADGQRLWLINDGARPIVYLAEPDGGIVGRIDVTGFRPRDLEDLALGPCAAGHCLVLADVGDNARRRDTVQFALLDEAALTSGEAGALHVVVARYPDGPHDAEAVALHPVTGDLWLVIKLPLGQTGPVAVYRLTAAQLAAAGEQVLEHVGDIPYAALGPGSGLPKLVTAMDISPDGERLALLTYGGASELAFDAAGNLPVLNAAVEGDTYRPLSTQLLIQAESIAYDSDGRSLLYTTESIRGSASPIARNACVAAEQD